MASGYSSNLRWRGDEASLHSAWRGLERPEKGCKASKERLNGELLLLGLGLINCDEELLLVEETFLCGLLRPLLAPRGAPLPLFPLTFGGGGGGGMLGGKLDTDAEEGSWLSRGSLFCGSQDAEERRGLYGNWVDENAEPCCSVESSSESEIWQGTGEFEGCGLEIDDLSLDLSLRCVDIIDVIQP